MKRESLNAGCGADVDEVGKVNGGAAVARCASWLRGNRFARRCGGAELFIFTRRREDAKIFWFTRRRGGRRGRDKNGAVVLEKNVGRADRMVLFLSLGSPGT